LKLSPETRTRIEEIFAAMEAEAKRVGKLYVDAEKRLEDAFAGNAVSSPEELQELIREAETHRTQLRLVHLNAHLKTAPLLSRHQKMVYNKLRGYDAGAGHHHHGNH